MKRAVGYIWISPNTTDPESLIEETRQKLLSHLADKGVELIDLATDVGATGVAVNRPQLSALLERIKNDSTIDMVAVETLSHLGRRFHDVVLVLNEFAFRDTGFMSLSEDIDTSRDDGKQLLRTLVRIPQLAQWTRPQPKKTRVRAKEVLYNGGACPYGYRIDEETNQYMVVPEEAAIVKRIFRERLAGRSLRQIANDLSKQDVKTKRGGRWQANTIKTILENVFYTGVYQCHGTLYHDDHDEIVGEDLFQQVNALTAATA